MSCQRCANLLQRRKTPPQAYWNEMRPDDIPPEIATLSEVEKRLLSRIIPFLKMIKLSGRFGQHGFRGQAVLFAQDVGEVAEQLPLNITDAGLAFITEHRENVENCRQYCVNIDRLKNAIKVLKQINPLYHDVDINFENINLDLLEISQDNQNSVDPSDQRDVQELVEIAAERAIVCGSFHQGHSRFFDDSRGRQCTANAAVAIAAATLREPLSWTGNFIDNLLIIGDKLYCDSVAHRNLPHPDEIDAQYLNVSDLLMDVQISGKHCQFLISKNFEDQIHGNIARNIDPEYFPVLLIGLRRFFDSATSGIITSNGYSFAIWSQHECFWIFNSHSRGPKGRQAQNGAACLIRCPSIESLALMLRSNIPKINNDRIDELYSIIPVTVVIDHEVAELPQREPEQDETRRFHHHTTSCASNFQMNENPESSNLISTSMLQSVDAVIPELDNVVEGVEPDRAVPLFNLKRKTTAPLNFRVEMGAEELCWWYLFPRGRCGLHEHTRLHSITPLDYYQARIMGDDDRFQRNDYLFHTLSIVEQYRAQQNVSVLLRMRQNADRPDGLVENIFLNMRSIRGSNAYWRSALYDLLATVRNLGPPQWFITFSCNDLNWNDMRKALLIAANRPNHDPQTLTFPEVQQLVEQYPVVISRQFMVRVHAIVRL